jgi:hypothetical protein
MKASMWILLWCLIPSNTQAANGYPVDGAWAAVGRNSSEAEANTDCKVVRKLGMRNISGANVEQVAVFSGRKRLDFGGYADTESLNVTVEAMQNGQFKIVEQYFHDGEGGGRPGIKKRTYFLKLIDGTTLEENRGQYVTRYVKCVSDKTGSTLATGTAAEQRSEPAATLMELWHDANSRCRGGRGDSPLTEAACSERERYASRLDSLGRCYGKRGQIGAEMKWHVCSPDSLRDSH